MAATNYSLMRTYQSYAASAPFVAGAFTDNASQADILQISNGSAVIVAIDFQGNVRFNASGLTPSFGSGGAGLYTVNRQLDRLYAIVPSQTITTVAQAFAAAFPTNPQSLDILHVIAQGGNVGWYVDANGVAHGS